MRNFFFFIAFGLILLVGCEQKRENSIPQMDFESFEPVLHRNNDTVYVINFWATWCKPCIQELPYFEKLNREYSHTKVKVILVSLDFPDKLESLIIPFVKGNNINSQVIHLTDVNANKWIDRVNPDWSGAIPATIVYKGKEKEFIEGSLTFEELINIVETKL